MFEYQPTLEGPSLTLRPADARDWDALFLAGSDPQIWEGHPNPDRYQEDSFRAYFADGLESGGALVAVRSDTKRVIGWSRYSSQFVEPDEIEIGWTFLARECWGGHYNAEVKQLMLEHAFRFVDRVVFRIAKGNLRSRRAAEKIGARLLPDRHALLTPDAAPSLLFYAVDRSHFLPSGGAAAD